MVEVSEKKHRNLDAIIFETIVISIREEQRENTATNQPLKNLKSLYLELC